MDELKKGQEVVIKAARSLYGTVVALLNDGTEGVTYQVLVPERTMYFRRADLDPWPDPNAKPVRGSKEWLPRDLSRTRKSGGYGRERGSGK